jgi:hypothetical protein
MYVQQKFLSNMTNNTILLEIKIPKEVDKSPEAMEIISGAFLQGGGVGTWYNRNWKGALVTFFSLEIASIEGDVRFFVRTEKKFKELITNNFYSQYPNIEIREADDYVTKIFYDHRQTDVNVWGLTNTFGDKFSLSKSSDERKDLKDEDLSMPADFKMIKTYVDYKQDMNPKEEFEHDPLTPILEWIGSMKKGEYAWYQLILQDTGKYDGKNFPKTYYNKKTHEEFTLKELADERKAQLRNMTKKKIKVGDMVRDEYGYEKTRDNPKFAMIDDDNGGKKSNGEPQKIPLTYADAYFSKDELKQGYKLVDAVGGIKDNELFEEHKDELKMINRKLSKPLLRALIRVMYVAETPKANTGPNVQSLLSVFKQYTGPSYNSFKPSPTEPYEYSWQNSYKRRVPWRSEEMFESYVEREAFYPHIPSRDKNDSWLSENWLLGNFFQGNGIDWHMDVRAFKKSLGFRKIFRLMWEGFFYPFEHMHPNLMTLNLEEVASLWHLPGAVATTPGIKRVDSLKSDAPNNLPR